MTEKPAPDATNEVFIPVRDLPSAPIIFFEFCPTFGNHNGLINIMLAAGIVIPSGGPGTDVVPVATIIRDMVDEFHAVAADLARRYPSPR